MRGARLVEIDLGGEFKGSTEASDLSLSAMDRDGFLRIVSRIFLRPCGAGADSAKHARFRPHAPTIVSAPSLLPEAAAPAMAKAAHPCARRLLGISAAL